VTAPPTFASIHEYGTRLGDVTLWGPYVADVLERHGLSEAGIEPVAGFVGTYPTFLCGGVVVKLFGYFPSWRESCEVERAAQTLVATDPEIAAPSLLAEGHLFDDADAPWPYLVTTRLSGVAWRDAELSSEQRRSVAAELGRQMRRVHGLSPSRDAPFPDVPTLNVEAISERHRGWGSLPPHLIAQIDGFLAGLGTFDRVFVHADLTADHAFVDRGHLTGIIDWGDAMVTDRHYELAPLHFDMFRCDKALLRAFLEGYGWPAGENFRGQALRLALLHSFDVFEPVSALLPLQEVARLDDLATELFAI
jgi:hygromycin-B 7''-O-kinase